MLHYIDFKAQSKKFRDLKRVLLIQELIMTSNVQENSFNIFFQIHLLSICIILPTNESYMQINFALNHLGDTVLRYAQIFMQMRYM